MRQTPPFNQSKTKNSHYAEHSGYFEKTTFIKDAQSAKGEISFYDSNTGKLLFTAPKGRTLEQFLVESRRHGWPSFRDDEVNWEYVRVLPDGECVSVDGTHLGKFLSVCLSVVVKAGAFAHVRRTRFICGHRPSLISDFPHIVVHIIFIRSQSPRWSK